MCLTFVFDRGSAVNFDGLSQSAAGNAGALVGICPLLWSPVYC